MKADQVSCSVFVFEWVLTLFSSSFEIEICTHLWDQIFFFGDRFLLKIAIAICLTLQKKFIAEIKTIDGLKIIKKARDYIKKEELFETLRKLKISMRYIDELYARLDSTFDDHY